MKISGKGLFIAMVLLSLVFTPSVSHALTLFSVSEGLTGIGSYTGSLSYTSTGATTATLEISLTNTSPESRGGYLTAFVFNSPFDYIEHASIGTFSDTRFNVLGGASFDNSINGAPYGQFDIGAGAGKSQGGDGFEGSGSPRGIAVGDTETFLFGLTGTNLNMLTSQSFFGEDALSVPHGDGRGHKNFVARFRGFESPGCSSDKVPVNRTTSTPEPASMLLLGSGLLGFAGLRRKRK